MTPRCALRPSGRCLRQRFLADARIEPWSKLLVLPAWEEYDKLQLDWVSMLYEMMVVGEGFEPSKSMTADLQSAPFGRSGTPPQGKFIMLLAFYSGKDYSELKLLTLRAVACGNVLSLSLESNLEVDDGRFAVSSLMIAREPHHGVMLITGLLLLEAGRIITDDAPL